MDTARRLEMGRVVHIGTDEVYGSVEVGSSKETDPLEPRSPYSASKAGSDLIALSGPYRFYDWDWWGRLLIRAYDVTLAPATQLLVKYILRIGTIFYGGNFALRREALEAIGGFDTSIEFHGEDTNVGRRLSAIGKVDLFHDCYLHTSARRYIAMGKREVFRLYIRNFISELLHHRPKDTAHMDIRI